MLNIGSDSGPRAERALVANHRAQQEDGLVPVWQLDAWYRGSISSGVAQPVWQPVSSKQPSRAATLHVPAGGARPKAAAGSRPWWSTINARSRERAAAYCTTSRGPA